MADGTIVIDTRVDSAGARKGIHDIKSAAKSGMNVVKSAFTAASAAVVAMGTYCMNVGTQFESGMSEVQAISGATGSDLEELTEKAKEMGAKTKFSATESAAAFKYMAMAGWKTEEMLSGIEGVMNLAAASGEDLAMVSDIVTDSLTAFGLSAKDSSHFADILAASSSNSNTNVAMLGESFKYCAAIAGSMGYAAEDTALALGLMANAGIKSSMAGTSLRSVMTRMAKPTKETQAAMEKLGLSLTDEQGKMKSFREIMDDMRVGFKQLTKSEKAQYAAMLAGKPAMSGLLALVNTSEKDYNKLADAIDNCEGATQEMADTMNDNVKGQFTIMKSALEGLGITAYEHFEVPIKEAFTAAAKNFSGLTNRLNQSDMQNSLDKIGQAIGNVVEEASELAEEALPKVISALSWIADHGDGVSAAVTGIASAMLAFKAASGLTTVISSATKLTSAFMGASAAAQALKIGAKIGALAGPIGLVTAAAVGLGAAIWKLSKNEDKALVENYELAASSKELRKEMDDALVALDNAVEASKDHSDAINDEYGYTESLTDELYELSDKTNKTAGEKARMSSIVEELNSRIDGLNLKYDEETGKLNKTKEAIDKCIESKKTMALLDAAQSDYAAIAEKVYQAEKTRNEALATQEELLTRKKDLEQQIADARAYMAEHSGANDTDPEETKKQALLLEDSKRELAGINKELEVLPGSIDQANAAVKDANKELDQVEKIMGDLQNKQDAMTSISNLGEAYRQACKTAEDSSESYSKAAKRAFKDAMTSAEEAGVVIPQYLIDGLSSGKITLEQAAKGLIDFTPVAQKAQEAGVAIPESLIKGIIDGKISTGEAEARIQDIIDFTAVVRAANDAGIELPQKFINGVLNGKYSADEVIQKMIKSGKLSGEGFAKGLEESEELATSMMELLGVNSVQAIKDALGIASPAKKLIEVGRNIDEGLKEGISGNAKGPLGAIRSLASQLLSAVKGKVNSFRKPGRDSGDSYGAGITSSGETVRGAAEGVANAALRGSKKNSAEFNSVGGNMGEGIASGIRSKVRSVVSAATGMVSSAVSAVKNFLGIKSPSRKMRDEVGKNIALGISKGVEDYSGKVTKSITRLMKNMVKAASKTGSIDISAVGEKFVDSLTDSIENKTDRAADSITKKIENITKKAVDKLEKANKKLEKQKDKQAKELIAVNNREIKDIEKASAVSIHQVTKSLNEEGDKLIQATAGKLEKITEQYDKKLTELREKRTAMKESLNSLGDLVKTSTVTLDGDDGQISYDVYSLDSLKDKIAVQEQYRENLSRLKDRIPDSLMDVITSMDIEEAIRYTNMLLSSKEDSFNTYIEDWKKYQKNAQDIAKEFYRDDINQVKEEYAAECKEIQKQTNQLIKSYTQKTKNLKADMKQVGIDVMKGFEAGMNSRKGSLSKAVADICNTVIATAKKTLDSHSPSRKFIKIGQDTIKGGEIGARKEAPKLYDLSEDIADNFTRRFQDAHINVADMVDRMRAAVYQERTSIASAIAGNSGVEWKAPPPQYYPEREELPPIRLQATVVSQIDGREVSRTIVPYMDVDLSRESDRKKRGGC